MSKWEWYTRSILTNRHYEGWAQSPGFWRVRAKGFFWWKRWVIIYSTVNPSFLYGRISSVPASQRIIYLKLAECPTLEAARNYCEVMELMFLSGTVNPFDIGEVVK